MIVRRAVAATLFAAEIEPFVQAEISKWADVVKKAGVKVE
jgi:hypothetical protein